MIKKCKYCNKKFNDTKGNKKYCNLDCYHLSRIKFGKINCEVCEKEFKQAYEGQRFCSKKCNGIGTRTLKTIHCKYCNKLFKQKQAVQVYCSVKCKNKGIRKKRYIHTCEWCGKKFKNLRKISKYCGNKCKAKGIGNTSITRIEKELYSYLNKQNLKFEKQKYFKFTIPDAFIPKYNLCVYADGKYWHSKEKTKLRDKKQNKRLENMGYSVIRLKEQLDNSLDLQPLIDYIS